MHILYATDGSDGALAAAQFLAGLQFQDSSVTILTVAADGDAGDQPLTAACEVLGTRFSRVETQVRYGHVADQILQGAEEARPDLVVLGSRGLGSSPRFFIGSVAERVARNARSPVLVVRPSQCKLDRLVVGVDGSDFAEYVADWIWRLPLPERCEIFLVTVVAPRAESLTRSRASFSLALRAEMTMILQLERDQAQQRLEQLAAPFIVAGMRVVPLVRPDHPALGLLSVAGERRADLIVLGSHGLSALDRFLLGSVSEHVLRHATCSVLIARKA